MHFLCVFWSDKIPVVKLIRNYSDCRSVVRLPIRTAFLLVLQLSVCL